MNIGVITVWNDWLSTNYGSLLQCYALQLYLKQQGHDPYLISRGHWGDTCRPAAKKLWSTGLLYHPHRTIAEYLSYKKHKKRHRKKLNTFIDFISKNIRTSLLFENNEQLASNPPEADLFICGSDQVWTEVDPVVFLNFAGNTPRFSYAAGGEFHNSPTWKEAAASFLPKFRAVSVREEEGRIACKTLGFDAELVIDPVMLLQPDDYCSIMPDSNPGEAKYLLLYVLNLGPEDAKWYDYVYAYAEEHQLKVRIVAEQGADLYMPWHLMETPAPGEFIRLFKEAECIVTNSYHGTLFSLLFEKPFAVRLQNQQKTQQNNRFYTILKRTNQLHRICNNATQLTTLLKQASHEAGPHIYQWRRASRVFLHANLKDTAC